jgi:hypothetical protein
MEKIQLYVNEVKMLINELSMNDIQEDKRQQLLDDLEEKYK